MAKQQYPTNMIVLEPSRKKPKAGDLFVCNMRSERWIAGRVIHDRCAAMSGTGNELLLYFYRLQIDDPHHLRPPLKPDLLIPPQIVNALPWRIGLFKTLGNYPMEPHEVLRRHCFKDGSTFCDEYGRGIAPPELREPWDYFGLGGYLTVDEALSEAIGMPIAFDIRTGTATGESQQCEIESPTLVLVIPNVGPDENLDLESIEEPLIEAAEHSGAGEWEGHGYDLAKEECDIRFNTANPDALAKRLVPILRGMSLPPETHVLMSRRGKKDQRIDI